MQGKGGTQGSLVSGSTEGNKFFKKWGGVEVICAIPETALAPQTQDSGILPWSRIPSTWAQISYLSLCFTFLFSLLLKSSPELHSTYFKHIPSSSRKTQQKGVLPDEALGVTGCRADKQEEVPPCLILCVLSNCPFREQLLWFNSMAYLLDGGWDSLSKLGPSSSSSFAFCLFFL